MSDVALGPAQRAAGKVPQAFKPRLLAGLGQPCPYCGDVMTESGDHLVTRDHILSRSRIWNLEAARRRRLQQVNLILVCFDCNNRKGAWTLCRFMRAVGGETSPMGRHIADVMQRLREKLPPADFMALTGSPK